MTVRADIAAGDVATLGSVADYDEAALEAELTAIGHRVPIIEAERDALYDRRLMLLQRGRQLAIPVARMAEWLNVRPQACFSALNDLKRRAGKTEQGKAKTRGK